MFGYEKLRVWQDAIDLVNQIYTATRDFPREEAFGLTSQMRRAAVSIPANIAEGYGRGSDKGFVNFIRIAIGSLYELRTLVVVATNQGFLKAEDQERLEPKLVALSKGLEAFAKRLAASREQQPASNLET